uniref:Uncharacterized protein n=1 Tax=Anguilla anguilla TaxID=7936 RepID=A0A0E9PEL2_ANGAN
MTERTKQCREESVLSLNYSHHNYYKRHPEQGITKANFVPLVFLSKFQQNNLLNILIKKAIHKIQSHTKFNFEKKA